MIGGAVNVLLFYFCYTIFKNRLMRSVLMGVQSQHQFVRNHNPAKKQEHEINSKFPE